MTQSTSCLSIAMAAPALANPRSFVCLSGLPPAADELLGQMLALFAAFVGPYAVNSPHLGRPPHHHNSGLTLRTPKLSVLGFASLLLGISATLMLFGSLAFLLGFLLMPLIVPASIVVCVGALLATFKEARNPTPESSASQQGGKILQQTSWF